MRKRSIAGMVGAFVAAFLMVAIEIYASTISCESVLSSAQQVVENTGESYLELSQAQRLHYVLENLSPEERKTLYKSFDYNRTKEDETSVGKMEVARAIRMNDEQKIPAELNQALRKDPSLEILFLDLLEFGDNFPTIFALANNDQTIMKLLKSVQEDEIKDITGHPDILKTSSMANRMRWSMDQMLINLIRQGNNESNGIYLSEMGFLRRKGSSIKRWVLPLHKRADYIVQTVQFFQRQLQRYRMVDRLIINEALSRATELKLTEEEVREIAQFVLDSPEEISEIGAIVKETIHPDFKMDDVTGQGTFDIYGAYKKVKKLNLSSIMADYDRKTIQSLKRINEILTTARERLGKQVRTPKNYRPKELRLYYGAFRRGMDRNEYEWDSEIRSTSNESYTVERRKTKRVRDGEDSEGNPKYKTVTYYVDDTVYPSFEDIILGSYDTGDGSVWGLSGIKKRARKMVTIERAYSNRIEGFESFIEKTVEGYLKTSGGGAQEAIKKMRGYMLAIEADIHELQKYANWSEAQILQQYSRDNVKVFRERNREMLERYQNMIELMSILSEQMSRGELQLRPAFDLTDYSDWLQYMKGIRKKVRIQQGVLTTGVVGGTGAYMFVPEVQTMIDGWVDIIKAQLLDL